MRREGIDLESVRLGSTPTVQYAAQVEGVTEIRPGTYVFYDRMQARLRACSLDECAVTVVATVVSRPSEDLAVIDVAPDIKPLNLEGFGHVVECPGGCSNPRKCGGSS